MKDELAIVVYDARGNGEGGVVPTITGDHENRITDYTAIVCYAIDSHPMDSRFRISEGGVPSVTAKLAKLTADGPLVLVQHSFRTLGADGGTRAISLKQSEPHAEVTA